MHASWMSARLIISATGFCYLSPGVLLLMMQTKYYIILAVLSKSLIEVRVLEFFSLITRNVGFDLKDIRCASLVKLKKPTYFPRTSDLAQTVLSQRLSRGQGKLQVTTCLMVNRKLSQREYRGV